MGVTDGFTVCASSNYILFLINWGGHLPQVTNNKKPDMNVHVYACVGM